MSLRSRLPLSLFLNNSTVCLLFSHYHRLLDCFRTWQLLDSLLGLLALRLLNHAFKLHWLYNKAVLGFFELDLLFNLRERVLVSSCYVTFGALKSIHYELMELGLRLWMCFSLSLSLGWCLSFLRKAHLRDLEFLFSASSTRPLRTLCLHWHWYWFCHLVFKYNWLNLHRQFWMYLFYIFKIYTDSLFITKDKK